MRYDSPILPKDHHISHRADLFKYYAAFLKVEEARLLIHHRQTLEGFHICRERTDLIDHVILNLWQDLAQLNDTPLSTPPKIGVIAVGGYGRRLMNRHSDIDVNYLVPGEKLDLAPAARDYVMQFNTMMCDLRFNMGTITDSVIHRLKFANEDNVTKTALTTTRFICGDQEAWEQLQQEFVPRCIAGQEDEFLATQLDELARRHAEHEGTPFLQQPEIKEGAGGLRDYQNLVWVAFARLRATDVAELHKRGVIDLRTWNELRRAHDFLLKVRNEMHYQSKKARDTLDLRLQGQVAKALGYAGKRMVDRIEAFMHEYYGHANNLLLQSTKVMDYFKLEMREAAPKNSSGLPGRLLSWRANSHATETAVPKQLDGFHIKNNRIYPQHANIFTEDPQRLMRLFQHTQKRHLRMSPDLFDLVRSSPLVNTEFQYSKQARETFETILSRRGDVARVLRQMHRAAFLGKFLPEFGALTHLVQHEFFHSYTADEHTLRCIDYLDELAGSEEKGLERYQRIFHQMQDPGILYYALLLHDTGRSANKDTHADESTILADQMCRRLQIKGERRKRLLFLVDNHLLLYQTATKKNPEDPKTIEEFVSVVKTRDNLDALLLMTVCDSKGVGPQGWNGYKEASLLELYHQTRLYMKAPEDFMKRLVVPLDELKTEVMSELTLEQACTADAHFEHMPRSYFNFRDASVIAQHIQLCHQFLQQPADSTEPLLHWIDHKEQGYTEVQVVAWDRRMLLARMAGALASENVNILSADFHRRTDNLVFDIFHVCTPEQQSVSNAGTRRRVHKAFHEALKVEHFHFSHVIAKLRKKPFPGQAELETSIPQWVFVNNQVSADHTVIELQAIDRIGLLYNIFKVIGDLGHSISHARISTERGIAVDSIYIQDAQGNKLLDTEVFMELKQQLEQSIIRLTQEAHKI
jgi:[protein-PII] uridylyltransferase